MTIQVTRGINDKSRFAQQALEFGKRELRKKVNQIGRDAIAETEKLVDELYVNNRVKRRRNGTVKLRSSFKYRVETTSDLRTPYIIVLYSVAEDAKVLSLENSSVAHPIKAKPGQFLVFPRLPGPSAQRAGLHRKQGNASLYAQQTKPLVKVESVQHPGTNAGRFMQRGLERAVNATLRNAPRPETASSGRRRR